MATLLFSCAHRGTIDIDKVKNSNHGIVILRPVFLNIHESAKNFYLGKFDSSKFANVHFQRVDPKTGRVLKEFLPYQSHSDNEIKKGDDPTKKGDSEFRVLNLEEGRYTINCISFIPESSQHFELEWDDSVKKLYFDVKPGKVNYIGDIVVDVTGEVDTKNTEFRKYESKIYLVKEIKAAKSFFKTYYGKYEVPFVHSPLQCCTKILGDSK
jgi:hypothetical protein